MRAPTRAVLVHFLLFAGLGCTQAAAAADPAPSPLDAKWIGMPLPFTSGLTPFTAAVGFGGRIVLGGRFGAVGHVRANHIVAWNGTGFEPFGELPGVPTSFCIWRDTLYTVTQAFDAVGGVYQWNGARWTQILPVGDPFARLLVHDDELLVVGEFLYLSDRSSEGSALAFDGATWRVFATLMPGSFGGFANLSAAASFGGSLYIGMTSYLSQPGPIKGVARWDGSQWVAVGAGLSAGNAGSGVASLVTDGADLYASGHFNRSGTTALTGVARWDGTAWQPVETGSTSTSVGPLAWWNGSFYAVLPSGPDGVLRFTQSVWSRTSDGLADQVADLVPCGDRLVALLKPNAVLSNGELAQVMAYDGSSWGSLREPWSDDMLGVAAQTLDATEWQDKLVVATASPGLAGDGTRTVPVTQELFWDGAGWSSPIPNAGPTPTHISTWDDRLITYGTLSTAAGARGVARWDGTAWQNFGDGPSAGVLAFATNGQNAFAGGTFTSGIGQLPGFFPRVARWDGAQWDRMGDGVVTRGLFPDDARVSAMVAPSPDSTDTGIILGGHFTFATGIPVLNIARWDGAGFAALAGGLDGDCLALTLWNGQVVAGGSFTHADTAIAPGAATWDGTAWHAMGGAAVSIADFTQIDGKLYAVGDFMREDSSRVNTVARWNGTEWRLLGSGAPAGSGELTWVQGYHGDLFAGGALDFAFGRASQGVIRLPGANSVGSQQDAPVAQAAVRAAPNPGIDGTAFQFALPNDGHVRLRIFDANGRLVATLVDAALPAGHHSATWSAHARPGVYFARLEGAGGAVAVTRVVRFE